MRFARAVYRFARSRTVAVVLLLALAALTFAGGLISQLSLAGVRWSVPGMNLHPVIERLSLNDLFQTRWAVFLMVALGVNLLLCTAHRVRLQFLKPEQIPGLLHFRQVVTSMPVEESELMIEDELRTRRFRVRGSERIGSRFIAARRNGFSLFGSLLFHLSLAVGLLGFLIHSQHSFEGELVLFPEQSGSIHSAGGDTLAVQLVTSGSEYNASPAGGERLRQRRSDVILYRNNHFERTETLSINHPIRFHDIGLFQADPAQLFVIRITSTPDKIGDRGRSVAQPQPGSGTRARIQDPKSRIQNPDTTVRIREDEPFEFGGSRYFVRAARLGVVYWRDSMVARLPAHAPLFRLTPLDSGRFRELLVDTLRAETSLAIPFGDRKQSVAQPPLGSGIRAPNPEPRIPNLDTFRLDLLNIRQGTKIAYRYDPALPWFYAAGALFLLGMLLRGFLPAYEFFATITEEEGETVIRIGGRALGAFTSLRPLVNRIVDRLSMQ